MSSETEISSVSDSFRMLDGIFSENRVSFAVLALIWVVAIAAVVVLPDTIPVHWGSDSAEPDRWGSRFELLIIPSLMTIPCLVCMGVARAVKGETYGDGRSSGLFMQRVTVGLAVFFLLLEFGILILIAINL